MDTNPPLKLLLPFFHPLNKYTFNRHSFTTNAENIDFTTRARKIFSGTDLGHPCFQTICPEERRFSSKASVDIIDQQALTRILVMNSVQFVGSRASGRTCPRCVCPAISGYHGILDKTRRKDCDTIPPDPEKVIKFWATRRTIQNFKRCE